MQDWLKDYKCTPEHLDLTEPTDYFGDEDDLTDEDDMDFWESADRVYDELREEGYGE